METQSAADLRNLLAPGTENREVNIDAQTVIMFLSFYLMCFFSPQATFKPLWECVSPVGHILKRLIPSVFASPAYLPICLIAADFEEIKNPLSHLI